MCAASKTVPFYIILTPYAQCGGRKSACPLLPFFKFCLVPALCDAGGALSSVSGTSSYCLRNAGNANAVRWIDYRVIKDLLCIKFDIIYKEAI
jgi:hypothetical protein